MQGILNTKRSEPPSRGRPMQRAIAFDATFSPATPLGTRAGSLQLHCLLAQSESMGIGLVDSKGEVNVECLYCKGTLVREKVRGYPERLSPDH